MNKYQVICHDRHVDDVEAVGYEHQHDFIVFSDADGKPVRSFKSKVVRDVKLTWKDPDDPDDDAGFEII